MTKVGKSLLIALTAVLVFGSSAPLALAHHDEAKGNTIVYEGGGGR